MAEAPRHEPLFERQQQQSAVELIGGIAWREIDMRLVTMEEALRRLLQSTEREAGAWDVQVESDVFDVPGDVVKHLVPIARAAYVARLLRTLASAYGVPTSEGGSPLLVPTYEHSLATLLRGLNDIMWLER